MWRFCFKPTEPKKLNDVKCLGERLWTVLKMTLCTGPSLLQHKPCIIRTWKLIKRFHWWHRFRKIFEGNNPIEGQKRCPCNSIYNGKNWKCPSHPRQETCWKKNAENINIEEYTVALRPFIESLIIPSVDHTGPCGSRSALYMLF